MTERHTYWLERLGVVVLLSALVVQCMFSSRVKSPTIDEFVHLPVGVSLWRHGDFLTDPINPPLMRMWAALPVIAGDLSWSFPADRMRGEFWAGAYVFMKENPARYQEMFICARWMIILLSVVTGVYVYLWARLLYGVHAGFLALFLYSFSPNIVAHSRLVTADLGGACFTLLTFFHLWRWQKTHRWGHAVAFGACLGLAFLSKLTAMILPFFALVLVALWWKRQRPERIAAPTALRHGLAAVAVFLIVVNCGYGFQGTFRFLGDYQFQSTIGQFVQSCLGFVPVPLPEGFVQGVDHALRHNDDLPDGSFYLLGELSSTGWWYYFMVAWMLKIPVASLAGQFVFLAWRARSLFRREFVDTGWDELVLLIPAVGIFGALSLFSSLNIGFRHVLPVLPMAFILVSGLSVVTTRTARTALAAGCVWYLAAALWIFPNHLAYFNELGGGPRMGHRYLVDSNLDWGQDLIQLRNYLDERGNPKIKLAYFGRTDPTIYGIEFEPLGRTPTTGLIVVSASFLQGRPYLYPTGNEPPYSFAPVGQFIWLQDFEPIHHVGYSLLVFDLKEETP